MAKKNNPGKEFEKDFQNSVPEYADIYRLRDGTATHGMNNQCPNCKSLIPNKTRFQVRNICDYIMYCYPVQYYIELKSYTGKSISFSAFLDEKKGDYKKVNELRSRAMKKGVQAGMIVNFRDVDETYYLPIEKFFEAWSLAKRTGKKSIPIAYFETDAIFIPQNKKVSRWSYDLDLFFKGKATSKTQRLL